MKQLSILFFSLIFILSSCSNSANKNSTETNNIDTGSENKTLPPSQSEIDKTTGDPQFVLAKDTFSEYGPHSITRSVLQDKNGIIWIASWEGIVSFDGKIFTNVTLKEGLKHFHVMSILEDRNGNLWFGMIAGGVYRYDGKSFSYFTTKDGLVDNSILCMLDDKAGNIWFATSNGVSRCSYDGNVFTNFSTHDGLSNNFVSTIALDKIGKCWFGTNGGINLFNGDLSFNGGKSFTNFTNTDKGWSFHNVRTIAEDNSGTIWIGSQEGLCRYDGKSATVINTDFIGYLFADKSGNLWMSGGKIGAPGMSLIKYDGKSFTKILTRNVSQKPIVNQVFGITEDREGSIWFGTASGICRWDGKTLFDYADKVYKQ